MEKAKVYFSDLRTSPTSNLLDKMERLLKRAGIGQLPLKWFMLMIMSASAMAVPILGAGQYSPSIGISL